MIRIGAAAVPLLAAPAGSGFVSVRGTHFELDGKPYYFLGANFWAGMNLASKGPGGDRPRLLRELDRLKELGVTNLRIVGASEGPDDEPWRMVPSLQPRPGALNPEVLDGLDFLVDQLGRRGMKAVVVLNNFWPWSGGMSQYLSWSGRGKIPYPPPQPGGSWDAYTAFTAGFYGDAKAVRAHRRFLKTLLERRNPYTGRRYREEPAVMAWELANEPRGAGHEKAFRRWIARTAAFLKSLDPRHLVTTGVEGETPWPEGAGLDLSRDHADANVDYATAHIWAQNWGWYDPAASSATYAPAEARMEAYLAGHVEKAGGLGKPLVVEEFGLARDSGSFEPASSTGLRDAYYAALFKSAFESASKGSALAGVNFWAWAGEGRPRPPAGGTWSPGSPWLGDPPHERQGWYSVYDDDRSTLAVLKEWAGRFRGLAPALPRSGR